MFHYHRFIISGENRGCFHKFSSKILARDVRNFIMYLQYFCGIGSNFSVTPHAKYVAPTDYNVRHFY